MKERRSAIRYRIDLSARFRIGVPGPAGRLSAAIPSRVYDLSESGVRLLADQVQSDGLHVLYPDLTTSQHCLLEIEITGSESSLTLRGRVVWYDRTPEGSPFEFQLGVEFIELGKDRKKELQRLVRLKPAFS